MNVLVLCRQKTHGVGSPFVEEQVESLLRLGVRCERSFVQNGGPLGYARHYPRLLRDIRQSNCDLVHAHYGLCGCVAALQQKKPYIITYHGTDAVGKRFGWLGTLARQRAAQIICVESGMPETLSLTDNFSVIPCGVDLDTFTIRDRSECRRRLGIAPEAQIVVFASAFDNPVKNAPLAKEAVQRLPGVQLVELRDRSRDEVCTLMNAADVLLLTSFSEGSPQVVKEAMACGLPIVSTDVGDVRDVIGTTDGCQICSYDADDVAAKLRHALAVPRRTNGRDNIAHLSNDVIAQQILSVYEQVCLPKAIPVSSAAR